MSIRVNSTDSTPMADTLHIIPTWLGQNLQFLAKHITSLYLQFYDKIYILNTETHNKLFETATRIFTTM